jgi:phytoene dehydrogenase-like protein
VLATDSVIGAMLSPYMPGSGYVLLHHVMGEVEGKKNAWGYAEGGMGGVSQAIARAAQSYGASLHTDCGVSQILVREGRAVGVRLEDGTEVLANVVLSNATPKVTFLDLLEEGTLSEKFESHIRSIDYTSPVTKINVALSGLPNFSHHLPNADSGSPSPHHQCTIHINYQCWSCVCRAPWTQPWLLQVATWPPSSLSTPPTTWREAGPRRPRRDMLKSCLTA